MSPVVIKLSLPSSASDWRRRAAQLFKDADSSSSYIERVLLTRRATAADNIADAMEIMPRN